jgi:hypothetical protein
MSMFSARDGTDLAYHVLGEGAPVIRLPGGPMQDCVYLGKLGGLSAHRQLIMADQRGTIAHEFAHRLWGDAGSPGQCGGSGRCPSESSAVHPEHGVSGCDMA